MKEGSIFALDIGTRTVIGIVGTEEDNKFRIAAQEMVEHDSRAMYDGQIHDISRVAAAVKRVKEALEKKVGYKLNEVAIAAAGRSLITIRSFTEQKVDEYAEINEEMVRNLELVAVYKAREQLTQEVESKDRYYYVGHSIVSYFLDDYSINSLIGHRARVIGVEVLATFLPTSVVDSLFSVLLRVNLRPVNLTLEPIAAADVVIPEGLRLLNLSLVDIGAGTSDIAISRGGCIVAYGMVPLAGDEISEAIAQSCLVDFSTAEEIKRKMQKGGEISYTDILGNNRVITCEDLIELLNPVLEHLAEEIAVTILNLNGGQPPKSVFCVGGGSQVPTLTNRIASRLNIDPQRVVLRRRQMLKDLISPEEDIAAGPEGVTIVGIATIGLRNAGYTFIDVKINGKEHKVFNFLGLSISHCLSQAGFNLRHLVAQNGKDLKFFLNGRQELVLGELSRPAAIFLNGKQANLQTQVQNGDEIVFMPAQNGKDARVFVRDYLSDELTVNFTLNDKKISLKPSCKLNDVTVGPEAEIHNEDHLIIDSRHTIEKLAKLQGIELSSSQIFVNGIKASVNYPIKEGDRVEIKPAQDNQDGIKVTVNGKPVILYGRQNPIFIDIFNFIDLDLNRQTGNLVLKLNGKKASYTDSLQEGDEIEIDMVSY